MDNKIKLIFYGTPDIAVSCLQSLAEDDSFEILAVVTQEDKPVGRKQVMTPPPVKVYAEEKGIPVYQPGKLDGDDSLFDTLLGLEPDYNVVVAYGQIMPEKWLDMPRLRSVNLHVSLLPKYRGASPMQEALKNGDSVTGVTVQEMVQKLDAGPILGVEEIEILPDDTIFELYEKSTVVGADLLKRVLKEDYSSSITPTPQDESGASYCSKIKKQDGFVDLEVMTAEEIYNKYRAYKSWPGIWTLSGGKRLRLSEISLEDGEIRIHKVHPEGKREMSYEDYLRGQNG